MPSRKPTAAGNTLHLPLDAPISIEGMSSDHTDAATMTPEAKPNSDLLTLSGSSLRMKNTSAAPRTVPAKGMRRMDSNVVISDKKVVQYQFGNPCPRLCLSKEGGPPWMAGGRGAGFTALAAAAGLGPDGGWGQMSLALLAR